MKTIKFLSIYFVMLVFCLLSIQSRGQSFSPITVPTTIDITPAAGTGGIDINKCWQTVVLDQFENPLENIRVDYTVTGVNSQISYSFTNADGISTFCYAGTNLGADTVTANVGTLTDVAAVTWISCSRPEITCPGDITVSADPGACTFTPYTSSNCPSQAGFEGAFAPANWEIIKPDGGSGDVDITLAPESITLTGSNSYSGIVKITSYQIEVACSGRISFDWNYTTPDDSPSLDPFGYTLNGNFVQLTNNLGGNTQSGSFSLAVQTDDVFAFTIKSTDDAGGASANITSDFLYISSLKATVTGGCGVVKLESDAPTVFPLGTTRVTWTATDEAENSSFCYFDVIVEPNEALMVKCPADITVSADPGLNTYTPAANCPSQAGFDGAFAPANWDIIKPDGGNGAVDTTLAPVSIELTGSNSDSGSYTLKITSYQIEVPCSGSISFDWNYTTVDTEGPEYDPFGYTLNGNFVQLTTNGGGNTQNGIFSLAVQSGDVFAFTISSKDDSFGASVTITSNFLFTGPLNATATGGCGAITLLSDAPEVFPLGTTTVKWTATDETETKTQCSFTVTVVTNEPLMVTCPADITVSADPGVCTFNPDTSSNCPSQDGFAGQFAPSNWTFIDNGGSGTVNTADAPTSITLTGSNYDEQINISIITSYQIAVPCSGRISFNWDYTTSDTNPSYDPFGYTLNGDFVALTANHGDNTQSGTYMVPVQSGDVFAFTISNSDNRWGASVTVASQFLFNSQFLEPTVTGGQGVVTLLSDAPEVFPVGTTTVTWTATDEANTTSECSFTVTVEDKEAPVITCPEDITVNDAGSCGAIVTYSMPLVTGICASKDVLVVGSTESTSWLEDVQAKLMGTSQFTAVDIFNSSTGTPTLAQLQNYRAVLVFTDLVPENSHSLGDALAAYIDSGGGVVDAVFNNASLPVGGTFNTPTYRLLDPLGVAMGILRTLGEVLLPSHPIMAGVTSFNGGISSYVSASTTLETDAYSIALYDNETPFILAKENVGPSNARRSSLNFFPPSSDAYDGLWDATTDGALIMANALKWVSPQIVQTAGLASGELFPVGTTTNTFEATDAAGNKSECSFDVTVASDGAPVVSCPEDITVDNDPGICGAVVTYSIQTSSDDCSKKDVLVVGSAETSWLEDVQSKLVSTSQFNKVDVFNSFTGTPALAHLQNYGAVLVFTENEPQNSSSLGDALAAYIDGGGGVVDAVFSNASVPVEGAFNTATYRVLDPLWNTDGIRRTLGTIVLPSHPIMQGVTSFDGGSNSYVSTSSTLAPDAYSIALYDNDALFILAKENVGPLKAKRSSLNFFPPSSDVRSDFWDSTTDGALIMANALRWVSQNIVQTAGLASGEVFPVGTTTNTFEATDAAGNKSECSFDVTVNDVEPLTIPLAFVSKTALWPPNHKMVDIILETADNCGSIANAVVLVTSNEPVNDIGDGNSDPDIMGNGLSVVSVSGYPYAVGGILLTDSDGKLHLQLRAERSGVKALVTPDIGRIYTITVSSVTNTSEEQWTFTDTDPIRINTVTVAHNITAPIAGASFKIGTTIGLAGTFWDKPGNTHTAKWSIDGTSLNGVVAAEPSGNKVGKVTGSYKPTAAGVYKLQMNVTDQKGVTSYASTNGNFEAIVVAYDPNGKNYTYGGGKFMSPAGALRSNSSATGLVAYGFTSNYYKNSTFPKGETLLDFKAGDFTFSALNFDYLVVSGVKAQFKGLGKMTTGLVEQSGLAFILTVIDGQLTGGGGVDKIRMKIYNKKTGQVFYDTQLGSSDAANPVTPVVSGSTIVIGNAAAAIASNAKTDEAATSTGPVLFNVIAYPNPTNDAFTLVVEGGSNEKMEVMVYDILGKSLKHIEKIDGQDIVFGEELPTGAYIVIVKQGENQKTIKLLKQ